MEREKDSLHFILKSDLYVDDKTNKTYFLPDEDFPVRVPIGMTKSVNFLQVGRDRTLGFRSLDPDYAEIVYRLQSVYSNELEGIGPTSTNSMEHAAGLVFEDYFKRNGIIGNDKITGKLINLVKKSELKRVKKGTEEYNKIINQGARYDSEKEIIISWKNGKILKIIKN